MSDILSILNKLEATSSRLEKEDILKAEKKNELLKKVILAALNPFTNYYQKKIPAYKSAKPNQADTLASVLDSLQMLSSRQTTGHEAIGYLTKLLSSLVENDSKVIERIIARDLKCGVDTKTVNKIWPGLIPTFDVMLAHKDISGIKYPCSAQVKMDGARCHLYFDGTHAHAFSRSGKSFELHGYLTEAAVKLMQPGETWDGELLFYENGKAMDRKTSNGLANKANKGTISEVEASKVMFIVWDIVDFTSTISYSSRWSALVKRFLKVGTKKTNIRVVGNKEVHSEDEAQDYFKECLDDGQEGAVLKNWNGMWVPKRSKDLGKMKAEEEADLKVVGWEEGTGKNVGRLGALVCETSDGMLCVNVGTGFSDDDRINFTAKKMIGKVITVKYNQIIKDKKSETYSLFLPRFIEIRIDKKVANSFKELK